MGKAVLRWWQLGIYDIRLISQLYTLIFCSENYKSEILKLLMQPLNMNEGGSYIRSRVWYIMEEGKRLNSHEKTAREAQRFLSAQGGGGHRH